jgi:ubiquinone/menaquinone biosynthesis C-methylase UbiE
MARLNVTEANANLFRQVRGRSRTTTEAAERAVGGDFELIGTLERELLIQHGLKASDSLVDVGCGSGRLTRALGPYLTGSYLGIDVVPELLDHARKQAGHPHWRFEIAGGLSIPEEDGRADMVCFFSVFTHLYHEQSYVYLRDAKRVLKPGGRIVFSFTEFAIPNHWSWFEMAIHEIGAALPPNVFVGRDAIAAWAEHLGLQVEAIHDGNKPAITVTTPVTLSDGRVLAGQAALGQSACVLVKP